MLPESSVPNLEVIEDTSTVSVESPVGEVTENRVVTQALFENAREYFSPKYGGHNVLHICSTICSITITIVILNSNGLNYDYLYIFQKFSQAGNIPVLYWDILTLDIERRKEKTNG